MYGGDKFLPHNFLNMANLKYNYQWFKEKFFEKFGNDIILCDDEWNKFDGQIKVKCQRCGVEWLTTPRNILKGIGCKRCDSSKKKNFGININYTTKDFIERARQVHGDKYDYSEVDYKKEHEKVKIICHEKDFVGREHGIFEQSPNSHLCGAGCPKCGNVYKYTTEEVKEFLNLKFDGFYNLEKTEYKNARTKLILTCPKHGDFSVLFKELMRNHACPICKTSNLEKEIRQLLKLNNIKFSQGVKLKFLNGKHLDFYLEDVKLGIECQGEQHFK
jgi:hypothetical protein